VINHKEILFIFRKPQPNYFSIEHTFSNIINNLADSFTTRKIFLPFYSRGIWPRVKNIFFVSKLKDYSILHITGDVQYLGIFLPPSNTVLTVHDCIFLSYKNPIKRTIIWFFWYYLPIKRLRFITTISEYTKSQLIEIVHVPSEKIKVIHNPARIDFDFIEKEFDSRCPTILQVGTAFNKNIINVSKALNGLCCKLIVIGQLDTPQKEQLASDNISYENYYNLSDDEMKKIYISSDLLLFVSTHEGFGLPVIEAQLTGRPVITSNIASLPEVAGDGALFVNPYNPDEIRRSIYTLIEDSQLRTILIKKGLENAKRFKPDFIAKQYMNFYKEVLRCAE